MMSSATIGLLSPPRSSVLAIGAAVFVGSGVYNIGADDHHTKPVLAIIEQLRDRSIAVRARAIDVPNLKTPGGSRPALSSTRRSASAVISHPG